MSFCIPVYNKSQVTAQIVNGLLSSDDRRFEIIVSDNASEDDTNEVIASIHDVRLKYYRNDTNIGPHRNWLRALQHAQGDYLFLVMSRDRLYPEHMSRLIDLVETLSEHEATYIHDGEGVEQEFILIDGIAAMISFVTWDHPTGNIFSRRAIKSIREPEKYFINASMYAENYLRRDVLLQGKGARISSGLYLREESLIDRVKIKSSNDTAKELMDTHYSPRKRTEQFFEMIDMIDNISPEVFTISDKNKYFRNRFITFLIFITIAWRNMCANYNWSSHYNQTVRHVLFTEIVQNVFNAYHDTVQHLKATGTYSVLRRLLMIYCIVRFTINRTIYGPFKSLVKKVLQPLGIWQILKAAKNFIRSH